MPDNTGIAWTDATWNPVRGCSRVSAGCVNCYAERQAIRHAGEGGAYEGLARMVNGHPTWTGKITLVPEKLTEPLHWRKPRRIFVNSMSDLFHEGVPDEFIDQVFAVMALTPQHTYQILTKRPERMREYLAPHENELAMRWGAAAGSLLDGEWIWNEGRRFRKRIETFISAAHGFYPDDENLLENDDVLPMPLPNVHLGVSVEDQATADERIPLLLDTPAAVRFVSYEPALAAVDFTRITIPGPCENDPGDCCGGPTWFSALNNHSVMCAACEQPEPWDGNSIDWVICGGESGPGARPCDVEWIRSAVRQCQAAGVPVFVKQLGALPVHRRQRPNSDGYGGEHAPGWTSGIEVIPLIARKGDDPTEWPEELRVQAFPAC